ncbi:hypothetical protein Taro_020099 [Colocasia esculenta]|uniref:Uncharacterized protein n=1 Tax=Colocasia esculenta TaxID=4460 RepID=A0A843V485_COLES|nr:hypothetical protein [Colocasia esculenta]
MCFEVQVVWQPYLEEGDEGQPWLVQACPYFGRSVWVHALNLMLPLHLYLCQRSLRLRQSAVEFPNGDRTLRPGRSFRGLHDTTEWRERAKEQIQNWEHRGKQVFALKYGAKVYKGARRQVDVAGEIASLQALLYSVMQDREIAQREAEQLYFTNLIADLRNWRVLHVQRKELERVRRAAGAGASSSRAVKASQSDLEDRLAAVVRRAEEAQTELAERKRELRTATDRTSQLQGQVDAATGERDQLRIRAEAAELLVAKMTQELTTLWVQGSSVDQTEMVRLRTEVMAEQIRIDELQGLVTTLGQAARSRSRSRTDVSGASGTSVTQYLAGSSSRRRNEEEERRRRGEASAQSGRGGGEMPPLPERQEGSRESGGRQ